MRASWHADDSPLMTPRRQHQTFAESGPILPNTGTAKVRLHSCSRGTWVSRADRVPPPPLTCGEDLPSGLTAQSHPRPSVCRAARNSHCAPCAPCAPCASTTRPCCRQQRWCCLSGRPRPLANTPRRASICMGTSSPCLGCPFAAGNAWSLVQRSTDGARQRPGNSNARSLIGHLPDAHTGPAASPSTLHVHG